MTKDVLGTKWKGHSGPRGTSTHLRRYTAYSWSLQAWSEAAAQTTCGGANLGFSVAMRRSQQEASKRTMLEDRLLLVESLVDKREKEARKARMDKESACFQASHAEAAMLATRRQLTVESPLALALRYSKLCTRRWSMKMPSFLEALLATIETGEGLCYQRVGEIEEVTLCTRSRDFLRATKHSVRSAADGEDLDMKLAERDVAHKRHLKALEALLARSAEVQSSLEKLTLLRERLEQHACPLLARETSAAGTSQHDLVCAACRDALSSCRRWLVENRPEAILKRTDDSVRDARAAIWWLLPSDSDHSVILAADLAACQSAMVTAARVIAREEKLWTYGPLWTLPVQQLRTAVEALSAWSMDEEQRLGRLKIVFTSSKAEMDHLLTIAEPESCRDPLVKALREEVVSLEDATFDCQRAQVGLDWSIKRCRKLKDGEDSGALQVDVEVKRRRVSIAGRSVCRLTTEVAMLAQDFPEVLREVRAGLPAPLLDVWCQKRTLSSYETVERLDVESRNAVFLARDAHRIAVVKRFNLTAASVTACMREAWLLRRLQHPHVVHITALFEDTTESEPAFYIEMPFYKHGQLSHWIRTHSPDDTSIRRVLRQIVLAVAHVHANQVVHNDIKPANILIGDGGVAYLADFDLSVDAAASAFAAFDQTTPLSGGTPGFIAPEVVRTGGSPAADMFAIGATIAAVLPAQSLDCDSFVRDLMADDPAKRPSATEALSHRFFAPATAWSVMPVMVSCAACLEDTIRLADTVPCPSGVHLLCATCFALQVSAQISTERHAHFAAQGCRIVCQFCSADGGGGCGGGEADVGDDGVGGCFENNVRAFPDTVVARNVPEPLFANFRLAQLHVAERRICAEQELLFGQRLAALREELTFAAAVEEEVRRHRLHIADELLTLRCPRCRQAFFDFDGCFALHCGSCGCGFCAWCLTDCGEDAHTHVTACAVSGRLGDYFGTWDDFTATQRQRREASVQEYLQGLDVEIRTQVVRACEADFIDLGLQIV